MAAWHVIDGAFTEKNINKGSPLNSLAYEQFISPLKQKKSMPKHPGCHLNLILEALSTKPEPQSPQAKQPSSQALTTVSPQTRDFVAPKPWNQKPINPRPLKPQKPYTWR